jgi:hypothetical protein
LAQLWCSAQGWKNAPDFLCAAAADAAASVAAGNNEWKINPSLLKGFCFSF